MRGRRALLSPAPMYAAWRQNSSTSRPTTSCPSFTAIIAATPHRLPRAKNSAEAGSFLNHHQEKTMNIGYSKWAAGLVFGLAAAIAGTAVAQPKFDSPAPTTSTSQKTNDAADKAMYKPVEYTNAGKRGPALVVIPGEVKSNNADFMQKFGPNNIADYGELELSNANFVVLERSNMGPLLNEFTLAYNMGDPDAARKILGRGKFKTTKWVVKFDILKAEKVASAQQGFNGGAIGNVIGSFGGRGNAVAGGAVGSVNTRDT